MKPRISVITIASMAPADVHLCCGSWQPINATVSRRRRVAVQIR
jgi:hypothetical protein